MEFKINMLIISFKQLSLYSDQWALTRVINVRTTIDSLCLKYILIIKTLDNRNFIIFVLFNALF